MAALFPSRPERDSERRRPDRDLGAEHAVADIQKGIAGHRQQDVRRALLATRRSRPKDVLGFFRAALGKPVSRTQVEDALLPGPALRSVDDPYE